MKTGYKQDCLYCAETFSPDQMWQLFCSHRCKTKWNRENPDHCFYCADIANTRDHIFPTSERGPVRRFIGQETVRCCNECNTLLGRKTFRNIFERFEYLTRRYKERYNLNIASVDWDQEELEDLGYTLQTFVLNKVNKKEHARNKVVFLRVRVLDLISLNDMENVIDQPFSDSYFA